MEVLIFFAMKTVIIFLIAASFTSFVKAQTLNSNGTGVRNAQPSRLSIRYQQNNATQNGFYRESSGNTSDTISNFTERRNSEIHNNNIEHYRFDTNIPNNSIDNENQRTNNNR